MQHYKALCLTLMIDGSAVNAYIDRMFCRDILASCAKKQNMTARNRFKTLWTLRATRMVNVFIHSSLQNANSERNIEIDRRLRQVIAQVKYASFLRFPVQTASPTCAIVQITPHRTEDRDWRVMAITRHRGWYISPSIAPVCMMAVTGGQPGSYTSIAAIVIILPAANPDPRTSQIESTWARPACRCRRTRRHES